MKKKKTGTKKKSSARAKSDFVNFLPVNKLAEAALYFGFTPMKTLRVIPEDTRKASSLKEAWARNQNSHWLFSQDFAEERAALLREHAEKDFASLPQPIMLIHETEIVKERGKATINLEIMGTKRSIAEALIVKTAVSMLKDAGVKDLMVEINSIGDKESAAKFAKELTNYYKKHLNTLSAHCRQNFKKDPFYLLSCSGCDATGKLAEGAPTSISCLSDVSRAHLTEVLEYIETMGIPYKINNCLVPDRRYASGIVFDIKEVLADGKAGGTLATGFRYDDMSQKIGYKKDNPGVGAKIFLKKPALVKKISKLAKPAAFYIQLGEEAKHKSLDVIDLLRREKIFIQHMLGRDKFGSQFSLAEKSKISHVIIMGKKEFIEGSVMLRENATRTQITVPVHELSTHIKKIKR